MYLNFVENKQSVQIVQIPTNFFSIYVAHDNKSNVCRLLLQMDASKTSKAQQELCRFVGGSEDANFSRASQTLSSIMFALQTNKVSVDIPAHLNRTTGNIEVAVANTSKDIVLDLGTSGAKQ